MGQDSIDVYIRVNEPGSGIVSGIVAGNNSTPQAPDTGIGQLLVDVSPVVAILLSVLVLVVVSTIAWYVVGRLRRRTQTSYRSSSRSKSALALSVSTLIIVLGAVSSTLAAGLTLSFTSDKLVIDIERGQSAAVDGTLRVNFSNNVASTYRILAQLQSSLPDGLQLKVAGSPLTTSPTTVYTGSGMTTSTVLAMNLQAAITGEVPAGSHSVKVLLNAESTDVPESSCPVPDRLTISSTSQVDYPLYVIGTRVYTPGGPDPWRDGTDTLGGCFPSRENTGVNPETELTDYVSTIESRNEDPGHLNSNFYFPNEDTCYIKAPGTVLKDLDINCNLRIRSKNVQIINSKITGLIYVDSDWCEDGGNGTASFSLTDSTVVNPNPYGVQTLGVCDFTVLRSEITGGPSLAKCASCTIRDSMMYVDEASADTINGTQHNSVVRVGAKANLIHNTFQCLVPSYKNTGTTSDPTEESGCSANQTAYSHDGLVPHDSVIKRNFYMSTNGSYCAWGGSTSGQDNLADGVYNIQFIENIFQRRSFPVLGQSGLVYTGTNCGSAGPIANFYDRPGHVWQCNRWDDGTELLNSVTVPIYTTNIGC